MMRHPDIKREPADPLPPPSDGAGRPSQAGGGAGAPAGREPLTVRDEHLVRQNEARCRKLLDDLLRKLIVEPSHYSILAQNMAELATAGPGPVAELLWQSLSSNPSPNSAADEETAERVWRLFSRLVIDRVEWREWVEQPYAPFEHDEAYATPYGFLFQMVKYLPAGLDGDDIVRELEEARTLPANIASALRSRGAGPIPRQLLVDYSAAAGLWWSVQKDDLVNYWGAIEGDPDEAAQQQQQLAAAAAVASVKPALSVASRLETPPSARASAELLAQSHKDTAPVWMSSKPVFLPKPKVKLPDPEVVDLDADDSRPPSPPPPAPAPAAKKRKFRNFQNTSDSAILL